MEVESGAGQDHISDELTTQHIPTTRTKLSTPKHIHMND